MKKAWAGRFDKAENKLMERFNASIGVDCRLYEQDIDGSLAHVKGLLKAGILKAREATKIAHGLEKIRAEIKTGKFNFDPKNEDIHMAVESRLHQLIGSIAGKLHSGRSRNDQVATDARLFTHDATCEIIAKIRTLQRILVTLSEREQDTMLPGYTHLQRAQPILLAHHLLAYYEMLERDASRFGDNLKRLDQSPLGAGALAGSPLPLDRTLTAREMGFSEPTRNSLDTVGDRDFILDFLYSASTLMMHLSRFAEELILWNSQEFGFVILPQEFCTGSSMMPQKINPDAPELIRGKTGRVYGNLIALLTVMKGLPLAYNKDMQEDKEPLFDSFDTVSDCLDILNAMLPQTRFNRERMQQALKDGFVLATDMADYLVKKGLPFREAHEVIGRLVRRAIEDQCGLEDFDIKVLRDYSPHFDKDVHQVMTHLHAVNVRRTLGGTATASVKKQIQDAKKRLGRGVHNQ